MEAAFVYLYNLHCTIYIETVTLKTYWESRVFIPCPTTHPTSLVSGSFLDIFYDCLFQSCRPPCGNKINAHVIWASGKSRVMFAGRPDLSLTDAWKSHGWRLLRGQLSQAGRKSKLAEQQQQTNNSSRKDSAAAFPSLFTQQSKCPPPHTHLTNTSQHYRQNLQGCSTALWGLVLHMTFCWHLLFQFVGSSLCICTHSSNSAWRVSWTSHNPIFGVEVKNLPSGLGTTLGIGLESNWLLRWHVLMVVDLCV